MDLTTTYMGLKLKNPLVASASPLWEKVDNIRRAEDAGASAIVLFSLFEEQIKQEQLALNWFLENGSESTGEALSYLPGHQNFRVQAEQYLELISKATKAVSIPIIASLNGISSDGWVDYATKMQEAGAHGLELNVFYIPANLRESGRDVERMYVEVLKAVKQAVQIPVALKLNPYFSSTGHMAQQFDAAGADALVLFNRFYQPDFDLDTLEVKPTLELSSPSEIRLALLWLSVLHGKLRCSLAATTGVYSGREVVKYLLAGADVTMTTSALLKRGIGHLATMLSELQAWMTEHEYDSVTQMKGAMSQRSVRNPTVFERANYIKILESFVNH